MTDNNFKTIIKIDSNEHDLSCLVCGNKNCKDDIALVCHYLQNHNFKIFTVIQAQGGDPYFGKRAEYRTFLGSDEIVEKKFDKT